MAGKCKKESTHINWLSGGPPSSLLSCSIEVMFPVAAWKNNESCKMAASCTKILSIFDGASLKKMGANSSKSSREELVPAH